MNRMKYDLCYINLKKDPYNPLHGCTDPASLTVLEASTSKYAGRLIVELTY